jgi:alpha-amylase
MPQQTLWTRCKTWLNLLGMATALGGPLAQAQSLSDTLAQATQPVAAVPSNSPLPREWKHGTFMQIYVRGYQDSNGDGIGDLKGLTQRLDYLQSLGVSGLWLMPITRSQDQDHGYAVTDYRNIEPDYGTLADFDELIRQAHLRGIGVIIDYVINHSGADHPLFESARSSPKSPYRDWYLWQKEVPGGWSIYGKNPWYEDEHGAYFAGFWDQMPDFNLRNPKVLAWHHDNLRFWLNRGVDGFRFDAVGNLVEDGPLAWEGHAENHMIMNGVKRLIDSYDNRFLICEAPGDPIGFAKPESCGSAFAFGHNNRVMGAAMGDPAAAEAVADYFVDAPAGLAGFVSNHDAFAGQRLWDRLRGNERRYRLAAATYILQQPAPPFVYYGEEFGMAGGAGLGGDHKLRTPMVWDASLPFAGFSTTEPFRGFAANQRTHSVAAQLKDPASLLSHYRWLIHLRKTEPALLTGRYAQPEVDGWHLTFQRKTDTETVLVALNYHENAARLVLKGLPANTPILRLGPDYTETLSTNAQGQLSPVLPGTAFAVFKWKH